ncbi:MAG: hypothetical protein IJY42_05715 [Clostridia bacterium]|nr:hypothetical protein [Clostridia bacterium]
MTRAYNYAPLHQNGVILFLERDLDQLATDGRPLSQRMPVAELYAKRIDAYHAFADLEVASTGVPEKTAAAMEAALDTYDYTCTWKGAQS